MTKDRGYSITINAVQPLSNSREEIAANSGHSHFGVRGLLEIDTTRILVLWDPAAQDINGSTVMGHSYSFNGYGDRKGQFNKENYSTNSSVKDRTEKNWLPKLPWSTALWTDSISKWKDNASRQNCNLSGGFEKNQSYEIENNVVTWTSWIQLS